MRIHELRKRHPRLVYESYSLEPCSGGLAVEYSFLLEPGIRFHPRLQLPTVGRMPEGVENLVFQLGLVELLSYWKAACPAIIEVSCGRLSPDQEEWWLDLLRHGLGEFFYRNAIDFRTPDFVRWEYGDAPAGSLLLPADHRSSNPADLVLVGGGKDSAVTLELLRSSKRRKTAMLLNPTPAGAASARAAGCEDVLVVQRTIDPRLLELNAAGYLNGHTPFSAYLAFLSTLVAALHNFSDVIASNEWSANEGNIDYLGLDVNHQYSKSLRFESRFRQYAARWLAPDIQYYSFLRPIVDLQIARLLTRFPHQLQIIRSCNKSRKTDSWCNTCPKCAFVYLCLFPFLPPGQAARIFGEDLFQKEDIQEHIAGLLGLRDLKPLECVGTRLESQAALLLSLEKYREQGTKPPEVLQRFAEQLQDRGEPLVQPDRVLQFWSGEHHLPAHAQALLRQALSAAQQDAEERPECSR